MSTRSGKSLWRVRLGAGEVQIICTLGPSSYAPDVIRQLTDRRGPVAHQLVPHRRGAHRGAHQPRPHAHRRAGEPRHRGRAGALRPGGGRPSGAPRSSWSRRSVGTAERITLRPREVFRASKRGPGWRSTSTASICASPRPATVGRALRRARRSARVEQGCGGGPPVPLPPLSDKDLAALSIGRRLGVSHYCVSFASSADAVRQARELVPSHAHIIAKIESVLGIDNMDEIIETSDAVLIDRGDLSRGEPRADPTSRRPSCGGPLAHTALRGDQPARVDGGLQPPDDRRDERHRQHAARRRPRTRARPRRPSVWIRWEQSTWSSRPSRCSSRRSSGAGSGVAGDRSD